MVAALTYFSFSDAVVYSLLAGSETAPYPGSASEGSRVASGVNTKPAVAPVLQRRRVRTDRPRFGPIQRMSRSVRGR